MTCRSIVLAAVVCLGLLAGCGRAEVPSPPPAPRAPVVQGIVFAYGVHRPKNVLDTTRGTFTKDMVLAPPLTVPFRLDSGELADIGRRLVAIDFWSYPSRYVSIGRGRRFEPPAGMEYRTRLTVISDRGTKTVRWSDGYYADDLRAGDLRDLAASIVRLVESKPEYERLPPAEGGYL